MSAFDPRRHAAVLRQRLGAAAALALIGVAAAVAIAASGHGLPLMEGDSPAYIHGLPDRTPGYPLILRAIASTTPDYALLSWVQYGALIAATIAFSDAFGALLGIPLAGLAVGVAIFANFALMRYPTGIASESLYLALIMVHGAAVLNSFRDVRWIWPALAGLALGLAILMRPVGYAFLFALPWLVVAWRERRVARTAWLAFTVGAPLLLACLGNYATRGYFATEEFGGSNLIMQVATMIPERLPEVDANASADARRDLAPLRNAEQAASNWRLRALIEELTYNSTRPAVDGLTDAVISQDRARWASANPDWHGIAANTIQWRLAWATVAHDPIGYAGKVMRQFYGMWFVPLLTDPDALARASEILARDAGWDPALRVAPQLKALSHGMWLAKLVLFAAFLIAVAGTLVAACFKRDPALRALAYFSWTVCCYFGLVAALEVALPRYSLMAWPFQCAVAAGVLVWLGRVSAPRTRTA